MKDVAAASGFHITTVSLALRGSKRIPESTREKIKAVADKIGYKPDPMLTALVNYRIAKARRRQAALSKA